MPNDMLQMQAAAVDKELVKAPFFDSETLKFQAHLIEPKVQDILPLLTRDEVLGNIDKQIIASLIERLHFSMELEGLGFYDAAEIVFSEVKGYLVLSRSVDGYQQKMLTTAFIHRTSADTATTQVAEQKRGFWNFGKRR